MRPIHVINLSSPNLNTTGVTLDVADGTIDPNLINGSVDFPSLTVNDPLERKFTLKEMCSDTVIVHGEMFRNLLSMHISLLKVLMKKEIITESELEDEFKVLKKYMELIKIEYNYGGTEQKLHEVVAEALIDLPKHLQNKL